MTAVPSATTLVLDDGRTVVLASVLAPAVTDVPQAGGRWPMASATHAEIAKRLRTRAVTIAVVSRRPDRYGRHTAHVWLRRRASGKPMWLQKKLLRDGLVRFAPTRERHVCSVRMLAAERSARKARRGLWALAAYRVRPASDPFRLGRQKHTFQVVAGRVSQASETKRGVYLNFGRSWRRDFTVLITKGALRYFARSPIDPMKLVGQRIEVRGWIEMRGGPLVRVTHTHQIARLRVRRPNAPMAGAPRRGVRPDAFASDDQIHRRGEQRGLGTYPPRRASKPAPHRDKSTAPKREDPDVLDL